MGMKDQRFIPDLETGRPGEALGCDQGERLGQEADQHLPSVKAILHQPTGLSKGPFGQGVYADEEKGLVRLIMEPHIGR
jgi:hypothetical protein